MHATRPTLTPRQGATTVYIGTQQCQVVEYYTMDTQVRAPPLPRH